MNRVSSERPKSGIRSVLANEVFSAWMDRRHNRGSNVD
jgi:hypothetical protein